MTGTERHHLPDYEAFASFAQEQGWTDGLPVVPPTPALVEAAVAASGQDADFVVGEIPPSYAPATIEKIAVNAVMAGCRPEYMPVVVTALAAATEPEFGLFSTQATTHPCGVMVLVSGPIATELEINAAGGCMGPGFLANATIGRAVRLALRNIGGSHPQITDMSTQGNPAKFTFCFAERAEESPWEPFHVAKGFAPEVSTVTVSAAEGPHNLNDHVSLTPEGILATFTNTIAVTGHNNAYCRDSDYFIVFGPEHAGVLGRAGWTRADVQRYFYERARIPYGTWKRGGMAGMIPQPKLLEAADDDYLLPMTTCPDDINILVAGGGGRHSAFIPTQAAVGKSVTLAIGPPTPFAQRRRTEDYQRSWGGWSEVGDGPHTAAAPASAAPAPARDARPLLEDLIAVLDADGYDLDAHAAGAGVNIVVSAREGACEDCLVPKDLFRGIVADHLVRGGWSISEAEVQVSYPAETVGGHA